MPHAPSEVLRPHHRPWTTTGPRAGSSFHRRHPWLLAAAILVALLMIASVAVERPLRNELERRLNASLKGYTATIGRVDLRFLGLGFDLHDVTVVQNSLPRPPVLYIPQWSTSIQWRALLSAALVADMAFTRPQVYVTLDQAKSEAADPTPTSEHGWQEAVESIYPLKINLLKIENGELFYWDKANATPLHLESYSLRAENIRNVRSTAGRYPSPLTLNATLEDGAHLRFDGRADFLAEPHATLRGTMALRDLLLKSLAPAARPWDVNLHGGRLAADGHVEYGPKQTTLALDRVTLDDARIDYVQRSAESERQLQQATKAATTSEAQPTTRVDVDTAIVRNGTFAIVNRQDDPPYRLFVGDTDARVEHFSNQRSERRGRANLTGKFMGSAPLVIDADFAPAATQADFRIDARVEDVPLPEMNDFLRAKAGIDVTKGRLSVYSEMRVRNGRVDGYVKPLFADMDVYDAEQDSGKNLFQQLKEALVGAGSTVLENRPRDEVATVASLSGPVENPNASTLDVILGLLRNAFVKAILPGLEPHRR
jgi:hypothetical protein